MKSARSRWDSCFVIGGQLVLTTPPQARMRHLRQLQSQQQSARPVGRGRASASGPDLVLAPGYTVLVLDTNVLLSSLPQVSALVAGHGWTVVVPLPVVMELDGLASGTELGDAAAAAGAWLAQALRAHPRALKVQTSRGNYLPTLAVRAESVEFGGGPERSMDDLILRAAVCADEAWVDRAALLAPAPPPPPGAEKVVLCTFDRNRECFCASVEHGRALMGPQSAPEGTREEAACGERARPRAAAVGQGMSAPSGGPVAWGRAETSRGPDRSSSARTPQIFCARVCAARPALPARGSVVGAEVDPDPEASCPSSPLLLFRFVSLFLFALRRCPARFAFPPARYLLTSWPVFRTRTHRFLASAVCVTGRQSLGKRKPAAAASRPSRAALILIRGG
jgi:hypothetical protein